MKSSVRTAILACLITTIAAIGAEFDPAFLVQLNQAADAARFSAIIKLHNPRDIRALDQILHLQRASLAERHRQVVQALRANAAETQGPVIAQINDLEKQGFIEGHTAYWIENLVVVYGNAKAVVELAENPAVESIGPNFKAELIEPVPYDSEGRESNYTLDTHTRTPGQRATGATRVNEELGITGEGVLIAGVDTGVSGTHPALAARWRGNFAPVSECWLDLIGSSTFPSDNNDHGTHTMGTMCGREIRVNGDTITVGAAPDAQWIATNPIDQGVGNPFIQDIFTAFQWLIDPDGNENTMDDVPDVIQNSWGVTEWHVGTPCYNNWNTVITNCEAAGPVIIWSAGNEGSQGLRSPATFELNAWQIFAVGAVDATNDQTPPYNLASFSSRGPSGCEPDPTAIKPEICAPGVDVYSSVPGGGYEQTDWSGTSMAGPHVSGVVALMRQACPDCDPQTIKEALMVTAIDSGYLPVGEDNSYGFGFLNAYDAVMMVMNAGRLEGVVTQTGGSPLAGANVTLTPGDYAGTTDSSGGYSIFVQEGVYSVRFSKFGYETDLVPDIEIEESDTVTLNAMLAVAPQGVVKGTVRFNSGMILPGAKVVFEDTPLDTLTTDANGRFVQAIPATQYAVTVQYTANLIPPLILTDDTLLTVQSGDTTLAEIILYTAMAEPTGPDVYGYRAYDRYDGDPRSVTWTEIDPLWGGSGEPFEFPHPDSAVFLRTPFPLSFYGAADDTLTVNANGWMLPGIHLEGASQYRPIPSSFEPSGIIAPFWGNMRTGLGAEQFTWFDRENGRWILEFINQRLIAPSGMLLNWQVQLLDPAFYPTATGDCDILFIYGDLPYTSRCTMGIESPNQTTGIELLYSDSLAETAWPITSGSAIRFTTGQPTGVGLLTAVCYAHPMPPDLDEAILYAGGRVIPSEGMTFVDDSVAAGLVSAVLVLDGYEMWRADQMPLAEHDLLDFDIHAWRLDPPHDLSASQYEGAVTLRWYRPESVASFAPPQPIRYAVFRDGVLIADMITDTFFVDEPQPDSTELEYTVSALYRFGHSDFSDPLTVVIDLLVTDRQSNLPDKFALYPNQPNPFNPTTAIRFDVPETADIRLEVFDVTGRLVRTLHSGTMTAGRYQFLWNSTDDAGRSVASGLYLCRMVSPRYTATQKMLLVK
ncbi:MAG: S8 family serine peptidase [Calditrichota bacterium]